MKKIYFSALALLLSASVFAQVCVRDSSLLNNDTLFVSPRPYTANYQVYALAPACINEPYTQSVTIKVPSTYDIGGGAVIPLTSASIATSGAIAGLPSGITYACDPPNCVFNANTLGCIVVYGTPNNPNQAPDTTNLVITASISALGTSFPVTFPGQIAPGNYFFVLAQAGACIVGTDDLSGQIFSVKNVPNPFSDVTNINIVSKVTGEFNFEVFNMLGQNLRRQSITLIEGENQVRFEAGNLANGTYFYVISNADGKIARPMVIAR